MLRQNKVGTSLAKLTKELIKLADSYKVPELKFDEQAGKRRFNYQAWLTKLQQILAMFSQTSSVLPKDKVIPFEDPNSIGNRALYLLISSRMDSYFQHAIKEYAHISGEDKSYFHKQLIRLKIRDNESTSNFIKRFTYAMTTAEAASNSYTDDQLVDFVLAGIHSSKQDVYCTAVQLYCLEHLQGTMFMLREIEPNFVQIDEGLGRDKRQLRTEHAMAVGSTYRAYNQCGGRGRGTHHGRGNGRGKPFPRRTSNNVAASANAAQQQSSVIPHHQLLHVGMLPQPKRGIVILVV
jgi:hypothetical protein